MPIAKKDETNGHRVLIKVTSPKHANPKELFQYRQGLDKSIPQKGGHKDYMPGGSWLEDKKLENFHVERQMVLSEPRVQRNCDLVKGVWNPEKQLVELHKEMRNFWEHMGFFDGQRKWLYPEEALFLMETNILEVSYHGLPISICEGYALFLDKDVSMEFYQVFAHLRRIGYVVLRHKGRFSITKYEQQIGLDKLHLSRKERKALLRKQHLESNTSMDKHLAPQEDKSNKREKTTDNAELMEVEDISQEKKQLKILDIGDLSEVFKWKNSPRYEESMNESNTTGKTEEYVDILETSDVYVTDNVDELTGIEKEELKSNLTFQSKVDAWGIYNSNLGYSKDSSSEKALNGHLNFLCWEHSNWNFDEIIFPDFGVKNSVIIVEQPDKFQTPGRLETQSRIYEFERTLYINKKKDKGKKRKEEAGRNENLQFSNSLLKEKLRKGSKACKNWKEYKCEKSRMKSQWNRKKAFLHLGQDVEPLVKPEIATSTGAVLEQLHVVFEEPTKVDRNTDRPKILPQFDVYKPDTKFIKSSPGLPDHRVVVAKCSDPTPELSSISSLVDYFGDEVQLNWAVVESGNIAFYAVSELKLPQDITMG